MDIGNKLKAARQAAGYTQDQVSRELGVSRQSVSSWENNRSYPELAYVKRMCELYGMSLDQLLKDHDPYVSYIRQNTRPQDNVLSLSMRIELIAYAVIWSLLVIAYHIYHGTVDQPDMIGFVIDVYYLLLPATVCILSGVIGADPGWGRMKWAMIPALALSAVLMDAFTDGEGSIITGGHLPQQIAFIFIPMLAVAAVGMVIGVVIRGLLDRREKKHAAGR